MKRTKSKAQIREEAFGALKRYQKQGQATYELHEIADMLTDESDRGVVVILGSLLEDLLLERVIESFATVDAANLTRAGGLLSSFDHRITLARALGLIALLFDSPNDDAVRNSQTAVGGRFMFYVAFVFISTILRRQGTELAAKKSQYLVDEMLINATISLEKHRASLEKRRKKRAQGSRKRPAD